MPDQDPSPALVLRRKLTAEIRAAQSLSKRDRGRGWASLNQIFRLGVLPNPLPNGRYTGELIAIRIAPGLTQIAERLTSGWMPWKGQTFDPENSRGDNIWSRDALPLARICAPLYRGYVDDGPDTFRALTFRTSVGAGQVDPESQVLKLDYDLGENPRFLFRRSLDELVQVADGFYLGKAHFKWWWGKWQAIAYFTVSRGTI